MTRHSDGFTLLEMVVAVAVLGLVMLGAAQGIRFGLDGWRRQTKLIEETADTEGADRVLRTLFHGIDIARAGEVDGAPDHFSFVGRLPDVFPAQDRRAAMTLLVTTDHRLVLRWRPYRHANAFAPARITETELLHDVSAVQFAYQSDGAGAGWQGTMSGTVPTLIRVHIVSEGKRGRFPDLIATPFVTNG